MMRAPWYVILICLVMAGCNNPDAGKKPEQKSENVDQSGPEALSPEEALMKEIQTIAKRDFRKATWGMPRATVKLTEADDPVIENETAIIFFRKMAGMKANLSYVFAEDKLVRATYMFEQPHAALNDYITDYSNLKNALDTKYGKTKEKVLWTNDLYRNIPAEWGIAVSLGYLTRLSTWSTKNTEINLLLNGKKDKINILLEYKSKALANLEKKSSEKQK